MLEGGVWIPGKNCPAVIEIGKRSCVCESGWMFLFGEIRQKQTVNICVMLHTHASDAITSVS